MRPSDETLTNFLCIGDTFSNSKFHDESLSCNSLLQLHAKQRMSSTLKTPLKQQKCSICDGECNFLSFLDYFLDLADGWHFNALSCGACSAFFRRSSKNSFLLVSKRFLLSKISMNFFDFSRRAKIIFMCTKKLQRADPSSKEWNHLQVLSIH